MSDFPQKLARSLLLEILGDEAPTIDLQEFSKGSSRLPQDTLLRHDVMEDFPIFSALRLAGMAMVKHAKAMKDQMPEIQSALLLKTGTELTNLFWACCWSNHAPAPEQSRGAMLAVREEEGGTTSLVRCEAKISGIAGLVGEAIRQALDPIKSQIDAEPDPAKRNAMISDALKGLLPGEVVVI